MNGGIECDYEHFILLCTFRVKVLQCHLIVSDCLITQLAIITRTLYI